MQTQARVLAGLALAAVRKIGERLRAATQQRELHCAAQARFDQSFPLQASRVLITGSTRGIGLALAEAFVRRGAQVAVHGRSEAAARAAASTLCAAAGPGSNAIGLGADLSLPGSGRRLVQAAWDGLGGLDMVINNAAIHDPERRPICSTPSEQMHEVLKVNLLAPFEICAAATALMRERSVAGRILNISTGAARPQNVSDNGIATYAVSKFGLEALSAFLAAENQQITVTTLRPDTIDTDMVAALFPLDQRLRMLPPESVVPAVLYLASAPRAAVHGKVFEQLQLVEQLARAQPIESAHFSGFA